MLIKNERRHYRMKRLNYSVLRSILALIVGVVLVVWPDVAVNYLVITVGALFFAIGLISIINYFVTNKEGYKVSGFPFEGGGSMLFGLLLVAMPAFFVSILMYVLGFILIMGGCQQLYSLVMARKLTAVPLAFYIFPTLVLVAGVVVVINPFDVASAAFMLLGLTSVVYGLMELFTEFRFRRLLKTKV